MRSSVLLLVLFGAFVPGMVDGGQDGLPIIDMHFHGALAFDEQEVQPIRPWLEAFDRRGVTKAVLTSFPHQLEAWAPQDPDRLISSLWFPCMTQFVRKCFPGGEPLPDLAWVRRELEAGRIAMLGEVGTRKRITESRFSCREAWAIERVCRKTLRALYFRYCR